MPANPASKQKPDYARLRGLLIVLAVLPAWELLRQLSGASPLLMPPLSQIGQQLLDGLVTGRVLLHIASSLLYIVLGAGIAIVLALLTVLAASASRSLDAAVELASALLHPLPGIVLLPVIVLWIGIGPAAVTAIIIHSVFWPILTNLQAGFNSIPTAWRMTAANYRLGRLRYLLQIALPGAAAYLLAGLRIAWARAWRALISAEMLFGAVAGAGGLGWYIHSKRVFMDAPGLFAGIVVIMLTGSLIENLLFRVIEKRSIQRWGMSL